MSKNRKTILISGGIGVLFAVLLIVFRGPLRENVIPGVVSQVYKGSVSKAYERSLSEMTPAAEKAGITFSNQDREVTVCNTAGFKGFGIDIFCNKSTAVDQETAKINNEFIKTWQQNSKNLEAYLLASGWHKDWNAQQPIEEIFTTTNLETSVGVNYSKSYGHVVCELSIFYNGETDPEFSSDLGGLTCVRSIHVFGYEVGT